MPADKDFSLTSRISIIIQLNKIQPAYYSWRESGICATNRKRLLIWWEIQLLPESTCRVQLFIASLTTNYLKWNGTKRLVRSCVPFLFVKFMVGRLGIASREYVATDIFVRDRYPIVSGQWVWCLPVLVHLRVLLRRLIIYACPYITSRISSPSLKLAKMYVF